MNTKKLNELLGEDAKLSVAAARNGAGWSINLPIGTGDQMVADDIRTIRDQTDTNGFTTTGDETKVRRLLKGLESLRKAGINGAFRLNRKNGDSWAPWPHIWVAREEAEVEAEVDGKAEAAKTLTELFKQGIMDATAYAAAMSQLMTSSATQEPAAKETVKETSESPDEEIEI